MKQTANYQLPQFEAGDIVRASSFNDALSAIDAALMANADAAGAARSTAQSAAAGIGTHGKNCRIATGSYTGTGQGGSANPTVFVTGFYPVLILLMYTDQSVKPTYFFRPATRCSANGSDTPLTVHWGDDRVSFWATDGTAFNQYNDGYVYYVALGYDG